MVSQNVFFCVRGEVSVLLGVVELAANLEADNATFGRQLLQQPVRHIPGDIVDAAQAVVRGDHRPVAHVDRLGNRVV